MKTQVEFIVEVLDLLGITQVGQDPSAEDAQKVKIGIDDLFDELARRQILYVQDRNAIESEYVNPLATILASRVGPKFGQARDRGAEAAEEMKLRDINRGQPVFKTAYSDYF